MKDKSLSESILEETKQSILEDFVLKDLLEEVELIRDSRIKNFVRACLLKTDVFWLSAATMEENCHPPDERYEGGLVLHTQRVVRSALCLSQTVELSSTNLDILVAAAILHDVTKAVWRDEERQEILHDPMHPYTVDPYVAWCVNQDYKNFEFERSNATEIPSELVDQILRVIRCSHGMWSPIPETFPTTTIEKILHMADLIASNLHTLIDGDDFIEDRWLKKET